MSSTRFFLNGEAIEIDGLSPTSTLLRVLRDDLKLTGTKEGCAEGDCGACTVVVVDPAAEGGAKLRAVNSCLLLTKSLAGQHVFTVEGLRQLGEDPHPVQRAMIDNLGSQCGYCTPGFVMALAEAAHRTDLVETWQKNDQLCGNLCRCTGYRPIRDALEAVAGTAPDDALAQALKQPGSFDAVTEDDFAQPTCLTALLKVLAARPNARIVAGGTDIGLEITKKHLPVERIISLLGVPALRGISRDAAGWSIGATTPLTDVEAWASETLPVVARMLRYFGSRQIKHRGTIGGNLCNASPIGDMAPVLLALDAHLEVIWSAGSRRVAIDHWFLGYRKTALIGGELLERIHIHEPAPGTKFGAYKVSRRRELDISAVSAAFALRTDDDGLVDHVRLAFGGMAATPARATAAEKLLLGKPWTLKQAQAAAAALDFTPMSDHRASADYRQKVAANLLIGFFHETTAAPQTKLPSLHAGTVLPGDQCPPFVIDPEPPHHRGPTSPLGQPSAHESARGHVTGEALYVEDVATRRDSLVIQLLTSPIARGRIIRRDATDARQLPGVRAVLFASDIPGENRIGPIVHDEPVLAEDEVFYVGQSVAIVVAETYAEARAAVEAIAVEYEALKPLLSIDEARQAQSSSTDEHVIARGDLEAGFAAAETIIEGQIETGAQDHFYLETQSTLATPGEDRSMHLLSSTQHPSEVQRMVATVLGLSAHRVSCETARMGGAFGGKESQAATYACIAAIAAAAVDEPVLLWLNREQDMAWTGKRHPFQSRYKAGFDAEGQLTALAVQIDADGGWTTDLSPGVHDRALFHLDNAYYIPALRFSGRVYRTNNPSHTAFRGFGGPQGVCVIEEALNRYAEAKGLDPAELRAKNYYVEGKKNRAPYGQIVENIRLQRIHEQLMSSSDYAARRRGIEAFNRGSEHVKRGIAMQPIKFGISFTVSVLNQAGALVLLYTDGSAQVNHGGTEMGQGLHSKMGAVAAHELGLPMDRVRVMATHTEKVPNTTPTAASSGSDLNGAAVAEACRTLRGRMEPVAAELLGCAPEELRFEAGEVRGRDGAIPFAELAQACWARHVPLSATGFWATPGVAYSRETGSGTPFYYFAYGASVAEVELNGLTGEHRLRRMDILHDVGNSLLPSIDRGQVEGAFVQGLGWLTCEEVISRPDGSILTTGPSTYKIPAIGDIPPIFNVELLDRADNDGVVGGSKAVGEPPFLHGIAVVSALRHAIQGFGPSHRQVQLSLPATPEALLKAITKQQTLGSPE